ncbi:hypothetical protein ACHAO8_000356 [Botrytis cinerea]
MVPSKTVTDSRVVVWRYYALSGLVVILPERPQTREAMVGEWPALRKDLRRLAIEDGSKQAGDLASPNRNIRREGYRNVVLPLANLLPGNTVEPIDHV